VSCRSRGARHRDAVDAGGVPPGPSPSHSAVTEMSHAITTTDYQRNKLYPSRRFFFFEDFFSFFFDDGTGVSSARRFPATCTNEPDAGAAPAAVPKRFAFASSIS
jgi:hypothetical protein